MYLSPRQVQTVKHVEHLLSRSWEDAAPLAVAEAGLRRLLPATSTAIYTVDAQGALGAFHSDVPEARRAAEGALRDGLNRYRLRGKDRFANHAVDDTVLYAGDEVGYASFKDHVRKHDLPVDHTLRVVVQHDARTCGWIGFMRGASEGRFSGDDRAMLQALTPQLEAIVTAAHVLDVGRLRGLDLQAMLDTFEEPAMICSEQAQILLVNEGARRRHPTTPAWLVAAVNGEGGAMAKVTPICIDDRKLILVVPRPVTERRPSPAQTPGDDLPPYLASVVELMSQGLTDREIAERTGRSYNTVRTYVRRLYARYGTNNRVQLLRALGREPG